MIKPMLEVDWDCLSSLKKWCSSPTWNTNVEIPNHRTVDQSTGHNRCWFCTFWNKELEKPRDHFSCLPLFSACMSVDSREHRTCLKKMQLSNTDLAFSLQRIRRHLPKLQTVTGLLLKSKSIYLLPLETCPLHSASVPRQGALVGRLWAVDSEAFSGMREKGGLTRISKQN